MRICPQFMGPFIAATTLALAAVVAVGGAAILLTHTHAQRCEQQAYTATHITVVTCRSKPAQNQGQRCPLITSRTYETTKHTGRMTTSLRGTRKTGEKGYKRCDTLSKHHQHSTTKTDVEPAEAAARQWPTFPSNMCIIGRYAHGHISAHLQ